MIGEPWRSEPLRLPKTDLITITVEVLGVLLESHFLVQGSIRVLNTIKAGANSIDWLMAGKVETDDRVSWAVFIHTLQST